MTPTDLRTTAANLRAQADACRIRSRSDGPVWSAIAHHLYLAAIEAKGGVTEAEERAGIRLPLRRVVVISEGAAP